MDSGRYLIVNADDFGFSPEVNRGILRGHERGIVTSASLMVRWPAAAEAAREAAAHPELSVGLHVDLGEWNCADGVWIERYQVVSLTDRDAVAKEVDRQVGEFRRLVGREPTHLDSHQHVHREEPVRSILEHVAQRLDVPLRDQGSVRYCGLFYAQDNKGYSFPEAVGVEALLRILALLPFGVTELGCHPAAADDFDSMYRRERILELNTLCDARVRTFLSAQNISLRSFRNYADRSDHEV